MEGKNTRLLSVQSLWTTWSIVYYIPQHGHQGAVVAVLDGGEVEDVCMREVMAPFSRITNADFSTSAHVTRTRTAVQSFHFPKKIIIFGEFEIQKIDFCYCS